MIHNGINLNIENKINNIDLPDKFILLIARLRPEKGHILAIDAFKLLCEKYKDITLVFAGDGPFKNELISYLESVKLTERVKLLGHIQNINQILVKSLFILVPSDNEPFGLVAIEGMAVEKLVIAKNAGGLKEILINNVTGVLVDCNNPEKWSEVIEYYLNDVSQREEIAKRGYEHYKSNFSSKAMAENYNKLYQKMINY